MKKITIILFSFLFYTCFLHAETIPASSLRKANILIKNSNFQQAIAILNRFENHFFLKGICHINLLEYKKALSDFLKSIKHENKKEAYYYAGLCYYKLQDFKNAEQYFQTSIKYNIKRNESLFFTGLSEYYIGNYSKAILFFNKINNIYRNEARYFKALCEIKIGKKRHAITLLKTILKNNPDSYLRNNIYEKLRQLSEDRLYLTAYTSLSYDSNVLREPESATSDTSDKSDFFNEFYLNMRKNFSLTEYFDINPEISFYSSNYKELNDYNLTGITVGPNFEFLSDKYIFLLKPFYENYKLHGNTYQNNYKLLTEIYINNCNNNYFNIKLLTGRENFQKYNDKDCYFINLYLNQLMKSENFVNKFGLSFALENADTQNYSFKSIGINEGFTTFLNKYFTMSTNLSYEYRAYDNTKWEQTFKTDFNISYIKIKFLELGIDLKFLKNFSNYSQYDYNVVQSTLYLTFNY